MPSTSILSSSTVRLPTMSSRHSTGASASRRGFAGRGDACAAHVDGVVVQHAAAEPAGTERDCIQLDAVFDGIQRKVAAQQV
ncbi:MAG: hypothetical protein U1E95_12465 [Rubrivivax sp.]